MFNEMGVEPHMSNADQQKMTELEERIRSLEAENGALLEKCDALEEVQQQIENLLAEGNHNLVRADLLGMELEQVFSKCADAMWVVRQDGTVVRANSVMLQLLNKSPEQVVGMECGEALGEHKCNHGRCPLVTSSKQDQVHEFEISRNNDHYLVTTASLTTLDGSPGIVAQYKNITRLKQAEAELERANKTLEGMAHVDGLTGLANRRAFDAAMVREWGRSRREDQPMSLLLCDIDWFKGFNDNYGHQKGDECLKQVAHALRTAVNRSADLVARYGGEEFAVILPNTAMEGALMTAERLREQVEQLAIEHVGSESYGRVTLSIGVMAETATAESSTDRLIKMADDALYAAKAAGRNTVVCGPDAIGNQQVAS